MEESIGSSSGSSRSAAGESAGKRLYFHHIPKTAGMSLREFLVERAGADNVAPVLRSGRLRDALRDYSRFAIVTGHLVAMPGDTLPTDRVNVTLVRHPVDRVLSSFYFERNAYTAARRGAGGSHGSLADWVASLSDHAGALNAHLEALWPLACQGALPVNGTARIDTAKRALDAFDVVGLQSSMADSLALVALEMGWLPPGDVPCANRTPGRAALDGVPSTVLRRLEQILAPDFEIYEHALTLFDARRHRALCVAAAARASGAFAGATRPRTDDNQRDATGSPLLQAAEPRSRYVTASMKRARSAPARIDAATIRGEMSDAHYLQSGERATLSLSIVASGALTDVDVGFSIREATEALVFATNTRVLGETLTMAPGRYMVAFRFQNELGVGHYRVSVALHQGTDRVEGLIDHVNDICAFDVVDHLTGYFEGRVRLHVEVDVSSVDGKGHVELLPCADRGQQKFALLARRNPGLTQFNATLAPLVEIPPMPRAAEAVVNLAIANTGSLPWPAFGKRAVLASYHWREPDGSTIVFDGLRTTLPRDIMPGESIELPCVLRAPEIAGRMRLVLTLVQEDVAWFDDRNPASACEVEVEIR
ncbi:MAG TPA: Wzt carbohydrate-binding domain-containing protein [Casimicrobiaceae bacterium]|nr:Wzt carbohydrate-binding domain-containing protein [Casimicrobiaceae bacterium]